MKRILFVCSQNKLRSPTAEKIFSTAPELEVLSAGTNNDALNPLTPELIAWADIIMAMEKTHVDKLRKKYRALLKQQRIICLDIPDNYDYMAPELIKLFLTKVPTILGLPLR